MGGRKYTEEVNLIEEIMKRQMDLPLIKIDDYVEVGMGGLNESELPIVTNGIATCMGVGVNINGINYFSHLSDDMLDYKNSVKSFGSDEDYDKWTHMFDTKIKSGELEQVKVYLFTLDGMLNRNHNKFIKMLNTMGLIDNTYVVKTNVKNELSDKYTGSINTSFKVGISVNGPFGFDYLSHLIEYVKSKGKPDFVYEPYFMESYEKVDDMFEIYEYVERKKLEYPHLIDLEYNPFKMKKRDDVDKLFEDNDKIYKYVETIRLEYPQFSDFVYNSYTMSSIDKVDEILDLYKYAEELSKSDSKYKDFKYNLYWKTKEKVKYEFNKFKSEKNIKQIIDLPWT